MLQNITLENLHHAYLLVGDIKEIRAHLSKWFLTHGIETTSNQNFFEISRSTLLIDDAREIKVFISEKSIDNDYKFVVISTEYFSHPSQHALLKTLEEPGENTTIFILVPQRHLVLPTIHSRVIEMGLSDLEGSSFVSELPAQKFAIANPGERMKIVDEFISNHKNDENNSIIKREVSQLVIELEKLWNKGKRRDGQKLKEIWFVKKYLQNQGASVKMLLEYLAVTL